MFKNKNRKEYIEKKITRKEFCDLLKPAEHWECIVEVDNEAVTKIVKKIKTVEKIDKLLSLCIPIQIRESEINSRQLMSFHSSIVLLSNFKYQESLHELHDTIYIYGKNLEEELSDIDYLLIYQWVNLYDFFQQIK